MKKMLAIMLALLLTCSASALAENLFIPALDAMNCLSTENLGDDSYCESYLSEDGLIRAEVLNLGANAPGLIGEGDFASLMELRTEGDVQNLQVIPCEGVDGFPAQRLRFENGGSEDAAVIDATAIWGESQTFVFIVQVKADAWYGFMESYEKNAAPAMIDEWISEIQLGSHDGEEPEEDEFEANDYGAFSTYMDTEFFLAGVPDAWEGLYVCELQPQEPFGYTLVFSEKESGFVFSLEARWFDGETVQLESVWQGYLGRLDVERLGFLDLLVTYSQPAPDACAAWQMMLEDSREVADTLIPKEGVSIIEGEYIEYEP